MQKKELRILIYGKNDFSVIFVQVYTTEFSLCTNEEKKKARKDAYKVGPLVPITGFWQRFIRTFS